MSAPPPVGAVWQGLSGHGAIGDRIATYCRRRGVSKAALAGPGGRSESWLSQVERGVRSVDRLSVLLDLSRVSHVDVQSLIGPPWNFAPNRGSRRDGPDEIRAFFTRYDDLLGVQTSERNPWRWCVLLAPIAPIKPPAVLTRGQVEDLARCAVNRPRVAAAAGRAAPPRPTRGKLRRRKDDDGILSLSRCSNPTRRRRRQCLAGGRSLADLSLDSAYRARLCGECIRYHRATG